MVHLCVSISDDGLRLESVQKGSSKTVRSRGRRAMDMATLRRQPRSRAASARQERGSCSSTASCPVFSGPYSDHEDDPPLRRQSSPLLKGSLSTLPSCSSSNRKGSLSGIQASDPCLPGSLPGFQSSLPNLRGSVSRLKRRSLGSVDTSGAGEWSTSPSVQSGSSSDDDGSWDTNSWSSGATCLLRTPVKQRSTEESGELSKKTTTADQTPAPAKAEPEVIYQNLIVSQLEAKADSKGGCSSEGASTVLRKETGSQSVSSSAAPVSSQQQDEKTEDRRKFTQFLNEVTCRVLKSNSSPPQQPSTLRHHHLSPPSPSTPSHPLPTNTPHSTPVPPPLSASATNLWYSPSSSNLQTIKEHESKDVGSSVHQWSKTLPSCKVLEPGDVLRKVKGESHSYQERDLERCTKIQTQASTGRQYLETDIDRVRRLDELVANGALGNVSSDKAVERESRMPWERNGGLGTDKSKESHWERDKAGEKAKEKAKEKPCSEKDRRMERGREKVKKLSTYEPPQQSSCSGRRNPCPVFSWPEGFPRMSYRSASLPRPFHFTVSTHT